MEAIPTSPGLDWPPELEGVVPRPGRCPVESAAPDSRGGYNITCRPADETVAGDYGQALLAGGFQPKKSATYTGPGEKYAREDLEILVEQTSTYLMHIRILRPDLSNTTWPSNLSGILPQPEGCRVTNVLEGGGPYPLVSVSCEGGRTVQDYMALLVSNGFVETSRMETPEGDRDSARLEKAPLKVQLMISSSTEFMVQVSM